MAFNFLGMQFGKTYTPITQTVKDNNGKSMIFSTPFMQVGNGNLSLPQVNKYYTLNNIIQFGQDNLYPQLLNQMYYTSAIHGACINFIWNATIGGGYKWDNEKVSTEDLINQLAFEKKHKFNKLIKNITRDFIIHRRICIKVIRNDKGILKTLERVDPSTIRNNANNTKFIYSSDWSRGMVDSKPYNRYTDKCKETESIYIYQEETPGQDVYPIPNYNSILNWCNLDGDIAFFQKNNIQNSVFPSLAIRRPKEFSSDEEMLQFKKGISDSTGSNNAGKLLVVTGNGFEDTPEIVQINASGNDKLFENTKKDLTDSICWAHGINPAIMGVKVAGSLGNAQELEMSYAIFEKNVILPLRQTILEVINDLVDIAKIDNTISINEFQIIEKTIVPGTTTDKQTMSSDIPNDSQNIVPNEALRGLDAQSNADIYRLIRDHGKGKLNDVIATERLKAYGISDDTAKQILGI